MLAGLTGPFMEALADEVGTFPASMQPVHFPAALGDGGDAGVVFQFLDGTEAIAIRTQRSNQPWPEHLAGGRKAGDD